MLKQLICTRIGPRAAVPGAKVEAVPLDLASLESVRSLAQKCLDGGRPLSVLVNNAGAHRPTPCCAKQMSPCARCQFLVIRPTTHT